VDGGNWLYLGEIIAEAALATADNADAEMKKALAPRGQFSVGELAFSTAAQQETAYFARCPFSMPAILKSSSISGQWMPIGMIS
jgi:hypothetical protein